MSGAATTTRDYLNQIASDLGDQIAAAEEAGNDELVAALQRAFDAVEDAVKIAGTE